MPPFRPQTYRACIQQPLLRYGRIQGVSTLACGPSTSEGGSYGTVLVVDDPAFMERNKALEADDGARSDQEGFEEVPAVLAAVGGMLNSRTSCGAYGPTSARCSYQSRTREIAQSARSTPQ